MMKCDARSSDARPFSFDRRAKEKSAVAAILTSRTVDVQNRRNQGWLAMLNLFATVFSTRMLMQIIVVLAATLAMKAISDHYDFNWFAALAAG